MARLMDIQGYWRSMERHDFGDDAMWQGKLLLEDDGWFEGIVNENDEHTPDDIMIFGIFHPDKTIELIKADPERISVDPHVFRGEMTDDGYKGKFNLISLLGEIACGNTLIKAKDVEKDIKEETAKLEERIATFKANGDHKEIYENTKAIKDKLSEQALRRYNRHPYTKEEFDKIKEEIKPTLDKVAKKTAEALNKFKIDMSKDDIFALLEQLKVTPTLRQDKIYFLDLENDSIMKIYEKQSWNLPAEDFKANTFYTIYSSKNSKMVRLHLNNPRYEGKKDESVIIPNHIDYFNDGDDYSIDLEQSPTPSLKIQYWRKENGENVDHKELTINARHGIVFTEEIKGVDGYTFASYDKEKENTEEDISTIEKALTSDPIISTFIEYYGRFHSGLLNTVKEVKGKAKSLNDKRTTPTE